MRGLRGLWGKGCGVGGGGGGGGARVLIINQFANDNI